jgi:hypothetical protein
LWAGYIATTGLYAAASGHYAAALVPGDADSTTVVFKSLTVVGVLIPWIINIADAGLVAKTEVIVVAIKMGILLVVIAAGVPAVDADRLSPSTWSSPITIDAAGMLIVVAYEGCELISNASAEVVSPSRTLPRAYSLAVGIVVVLVHRDRNGRRRLGDAGGDRRIAGLRTREGGVGLARTIRFRHRCDLGRVGDILGDQRHVVRRLPTELHARHRR